MPPPRPLTRGFDRRRFRRTAAAESRRWHSSDPRSPGSGSEACGEAGLCAGVSVFEPRKMDGGRAVCCRSAGGDDVALRRLFGRVDQIGRRCLRLRFVGGHWVAKSGALGEVLPTGRPEPAPTAVIAIESGFKPLRRCTACNPRPNSAADAGRSAGSIAIALLDRRAHRVRDSVWTQVGDPRGADPQCTARRGPRHCWRS